MFTIEDREFGEWYFAPSDDEGGRRLMQSGPVRVVEEMLTGYGRIDVKREGRDVVIAGYVGLTPSWVHITGAYVFDNGNPQGGHALLSIPATAVHGIAWLKEHPHWDLSWDDFVDAPEPPYEPWRGTRQAVSSVT
jgi:hypothetical protein